MSEKLAQSIDCLAMKDRIQQKIYEEIKDLTPEEEIAYFRRKVESGPFAEMWRRLKDAPTVQPKPQP